MEKNENILKSKLDLSQNISNNLCKTILPSISYTPESPSLSIVKIAAVTIAPRKIYHPSVINACEAMFKKHPDQLTKDEEIKFNHYRKWKTYMNDPLETNVVYLLAGGLRKCLVCENLT